MNIQALLKSKNLAITSNRIRIIECLQDGMDFHTIAEIVEHIKDINTKSVYNNIKQLIDAGIIDSYSFGGISKYAVNDNIENIDKTISRIHLVHNEEEIHHLDVEKSIFEAIKKEVEKSGHDVTSIKIFVSVKEEK